MKPWTKNQLRRLRIALMINSDKRNKYLNKRIIFKNKINIKIYYKLILIEILIDVNHIRRCDAHTLSWDCGQK